MLRKRCVKRADLNRCILRSHLTINMPELPVNAPRIYVLEFGFNKDFVNATSVRH